MLGNYRYGVDKSKIYEPGKPFNLENFKKNLYTIINLLSEDKGDICNLHRYLLDELKADIHVARGELDDARNIYDNIKNKFYCSHSERAFLEWMQTINYKLESLPKEL